MLKGISLVVAMTALFAMETADAAVSPPPPVCSDAVKVGTNPETGHYYEVYAASAITWEVAKQIAAGKVRDGVNGHLATITSTSEDKWIDGLRKSALQSVSLPCGLAQPEVWVGGRQAASSVAGENWSWDNGEGAIATPAKPLPSYSNWLNGEPNDNTGPQSENFLAIGLRDEFGWNDEGALGNIGGYIVEYDIPRSAAECTTAGGCETINGHTLIVPQGWVEAGDKFSSTAYEFTDPRVAAGTKPSTCGKDPLILFSDVNDGKPELRIPAYLCGSPKFVVIAVKGGDFSFGRGGTVLIENDTATVLRENTIKDCKDTKGPILPTPGEDPQYQDVVVYQTTDPARMLEDGLGTGLYDGAAGEFTNACGSSRGAAEEASYFVVGMHIDFGPGYERAGNLLANRQAFVDLTLYKLSLLQQSVLDARSAGALKNGDTSKMLAQLDNAVKKLGRGDPSGALGHVNQFLRFVAAAKYTQALRNYNGAHLMRGANIEFTLRVKVIP